MHTDRLITALCKYWMPIDREYYWNKMDIPTTNCAIQVSGFPKEIADWIWVKQYNAFEVF
jgi:hypothetical protein